MTMIERANMAFISKLEHALAHIQKELQDAGFVGLDLSSLKSVFEEQALRKYSKEMPEPENPVILEFGTDESSSPTPLARSLCCCFIRRWCDDLTRAVAAIEQSEDEKLGHWVRRKTGQETRVDFDRLTVHEVSNKASLVQLLKVLHRVMQWDTARLQQFVEGNVKNSTGVEAFIRDLAHVRLVDPQFAFVMKDMFFVTDPRVYDEVLNSLKEHENFKVLLFLCEILKKRIELNIGDEEWQIA